MSLLRFRKYRRSADPSAKPEITSFADVTLVLLVIFLVSAAATVEVIQLTLPDAGNTQSRDINLAVTISVGPDGKFYFEDTPTPIESRNLWEALNEIRGESAWDLALVRADRKTPVEHVGLLVQCLQSMGVNEFAFVMKDRQDKPDEKEKS